MTVGSTRPARPLDELLCFDLYAASRAVTALYRPLLGELGLTYPQYLALVMLQPGEVVSVKDVGAALHLDHGTLTPLLRRLEHAGLLTRTRSGVDERRVEIALTPAGEELKGRFEDVQCSIGDAMGLTGGEMRRLQVALRTLMASVEEPVEEQVG